MDLLRFNSAFVWTFDGYEQLSVKVWCKIDDSKNTRLASNACVEQIPIAIGPDKRVVYMGIKNFSKKRFKKMDAGY